MRRKERVSYVYANTHVIGANTETNTKSSSLIFYDIYSWQTSHILFISHLLEMVWTVRYLRQIVLFSRHYITHLKVVKTKANCHTFCQDQWLNHFSYVWCKCTIARISDLISLIHSIECVHVLIMTLKSMYEITRMADIMSL